MTKILPNYSRRPQVFESLVFRWAYLVNGMEYAHNTCQFFISSYYPPPTETFEQDWRWSCNSNKKCLR